MSHAKHIHSVEVRAPSLDDMRAARLAGHEAEALAPISEISEVRWQSNFPRRDKPNAAI